MTRLTKTILTYAAIIVVTLLVAEAFSFALLVWQSARMDNVGLGQAIFKRIDQHPLIDRLKVRGTGESEYVFVPPTQYTLRPNATFSGRGQPVLGRGHGHLRGDRCLAATSRASNHLMHEPVHVIIAIKVIFWYII